MEERMQKTDILPIPLLGYTMTAIDTDVVSAQRMFDVNVFGPMRMVHHFHDMLIRASGTVVNIGSIGGIVPYVYGCRSIFGFYHCLSVALLADPKMSIL